MYPKISGTLGFSFPQYMVEVLKGEQDVLFTARAVNPRVSSHLVSSLPQKESRKDCSTCVNSLVPLSRPEIKDEDVFDDIIPSETTVESDTFEGVQKKKLDAMNPVFCVLPSDFEE